MLGWGTAVTRIPELLRVQYGDADAAEQQYESMKTFVDCEIRKMGKKNLWIAPNLGDWLALGKGMAWQAMHNGPGWMYQVKAGATTIWERWDALRPDGTVNEEKSGSDNMVSFNHYAFGSVGEFYYEYIPGIRPLEDGFRKVLIRPYPDERLGKVSGKYLSRAGEIGSAWEYRDDKVCFDISVPTRARIVLPDGQKQDMEAGTYHFEMAR